NFAVQAREAQAARHAPLGGSAHEAYRAMLELRADPEPWLAVLDARLEPLFKLKEFLTGLLPELESEKFSVRQKATEQMERLGEMAIPFLEEKLQDKARSLETMRRIENVIRRVSPNEAGGHSTFLQWWRT